MKKLSIPSLNKYISIFLILIFLFVFKMSDIYGLSHFSQEEADFMEQNFSMSIPNINNCNLDYYNLKNHIDKGNFNKVRYRKIITDDENCFGKVLYSGQVPGTQFSELDSETYVEFGVNQKIGYPLWLFEKQFVIFLLLILFVLILQLINKTRNYYLIILIVITIFSILSFSKQNMFINSAKQYFPNENTKNISIMINWFSSND